MKRDPKESFYQILKENLGKKIFLSYQKNGKPKEDLLLLLRLDAIGLLALNKDEHRIEIVFEDIKSVTIKNIEFMNIKSFVGKEKKTQDPSKVYLISHSISEIIRLLKKEEEYSLQTRKAIFSKNGSFRKKKTSAYDLEIAIYKWLTTKKRILLCPIAILNNEKLIAINHEGQFAVLDKKGREHPIFLQDFIVQTNEEISLFNEKNLSHLAQKLLGLFYSFTKKSRALSMILFFCIFKFIYFIFL